MSFHSRSFLPIRIKEVRFDRAHGKPGVLSLRTNREQTISSLSLLGSQELRSSVVSVLLSLIPGTPSIAGLYRINRMFEQRVPIQSSLCRTHGLSRYCSTSGFGPRSPWRVSNDSPNKCARSTLLISIVFRCLYGEEGAVQDDLPSFFPSSSKAKESSLKKHRAEKPQELNDGQRNRCLVACVPTHTYLTRVYTVIT